MIRVEDGYQVAYDLPEVIALAEAAAESDPEAAMEIAQDGSRLRMTAGPKRMLAALGDEGRVVGSRLTLAFGRRAPVAAVKSDGTASELAWMRSNLADGGKRLYLTRAAEADSGWLIAGNPTLDQRRPPYNVRERYMPRLSGIHGEGYLLDLETGLSYRAEPGMAALRGSYREMCRLAARLNSA